MATSTTVKAAAKKLLKGCDITKAPVSVEELAKHLGVTINYEPFKEDLSGVLVKDKKRTVIGVNSSHPKTRQRFTIAHEIGHFVLNHEGQLFVDKMVMKRDGRSSQAIDIKEIDANGFAAEILMPETIVLESVSRLHSNKPNYSTGDLIEELAEEFQVSPQAMEYRLTNLGIFMPQ